MTGRVEGKVALITGAARGQGRAHAVRLAEEGADIIALDICFPIRGVTYPAATEEDLAETAAQVRALGRRIVPKAADTRDRAALNSSLADGVHQLGRLDIVVANAGICIIGKWNEITDDDFRDTVDVNLVGTWNTVVASVPYLIDNGAGAVILVSSTAGLKGMPFNAPYVASKHGVTGLARALAHELGQYNIRVNSLHPGGVRSAMLEGETMGKINAAIESNPRLSGMFTNSLPFEMTEPEDQANAVLFLASDEARYVTALAMTVDLGTSQY